VSPDRRGVDEKPGFIDSRTSDTVDDGVALTGSAVAAQLAPAKVVLVVAASTRQPVRPWAQAP